MKHPPIQIVDEHDQPLRPGTMEEAQREGLWHRVVRVVIEDEAGRTLLQRRSSSVAFANCWDASAAGHVDAGEDYLTAAKREMHEEIGVQSVELGEMESYKSEAVYGNRILNRFNKIYKAYVRSSQRFKPEPDEVAELKWFTPAELTKLFQTQPDRITDGLRHILEQRV